MSAGFVVLIVDDSGDDSHLFRHAFKQIGVETRFAVDGLEAIDYLKGVGAFSDREAFPFPEAVLLDLKMPRMNGFEFLEWVRQNPAYRVIPTIIFSSSNMPSDIEQAYELGVTTYFKKPVAFHDLGPLFQKIIAYWEEAEVPQPSVRVEHS